MQAGHEVAAGSRGARVCRRHRRSVGPRTSRNHSRARFTSNYGKRRCGSKAAPIQGWCACCWSAYGDDWAADEHASLDCRGSDGLAAWVYGAKCAGGEHTGAEAILGTRLRVSRAAGRSDQGSLVRRRRIVSVREATGAWAIRLAASGERHGFADAGAVIDAARRHRLAATGADVGSAAVGVTGEILCTTFFARTGMRTRAFMRYSAHVSGGAPRSQRSSRRCAASADPGTIRATDLAGARDRASAAAVGQVAAHAVWAQVGEAGAADRTVGTAAGGVGIKAQRARARRVNARSRHRLFNSDNEGHAPRTARSSSAKNTQTRAEGNGMPGMSGRTAQVRRGCLRDAGVRARQLRGDSPRAHQAELHEV